MGDITSVKFTVVRPTDTPATPTVNAATGSVPEDGHGQYTVAPSVNSIAGPYLAFAQFFYSEKAVNKQKTVPLTYDCIDPLEQSVLGTLAAPAIDLAWVYISDCFPPGTQVLMADGTYRSIEEIREGDEVIDHNGMRQGVYNTVKRTELEKLYSFTRKGYGNAAPIKSTHNHPFLVIDSRYGYKDLKHLNETQILDLATWKRAEDLQAKDWFIERYPAHKELTRSIDTTDFDYSVRPPLPETVLVKSGSGQSAIRDCYGCGEPIRREANRMLRSVASYCSKACQKGSLGIERARHDIPHSIELNSAFGRWVGWFLAEGDVNLNSLGEPSVTRFGLHVDEARERDEILSLGSELFGVKGNIYQVGDSNGIVIHFHNAQLAKMMKIFGNSSHNKALPEGWMNAPMDFLEEVVSAHLDGDGWQAENILTHRTSSPVLMQQIMQIYRWMKYAPSVSVTQPTEQNRLTAVSYNVGVKPDAASLKGRLLWDELGVSQITSITEEPYMGWVYCLDVENSHSFIANGVVAHNCFDSEIGGPWLRDMTLNRFDKSKVQQFIPRVIWDINMYPPQTNYSPESFPYSDHNGMAVIAQGLLVNIAKHLMRSYAEQPDVTNSPAGFLNRQRYMDTWKAVYDVENEEYQRMIDEIKRLEFNKVGASILVGGRGNRMLWSNFRSRNILRGF